jgi:hypothetical protein
MTGTAQARPEPSAIAVLLAGDCDPDQLRSLLSRFGMRTAVLAMRAKIPGSYWGESEAGLIGDTLYFRADTPVHSILHEACHFICMDSQRRAALERDAGGDHAEENGVCYLQILLADSVPGFGRERMLRDMDAWGYTFRLGSARRWFEEDAGDARAWLIEQGLIDAQARVSWRLRK